MSEEEAKISKGGAYGSVMVIIGIIIGLLMFYYDMGFIPVICVPLIFIGVYLIISSFGRSQVEDVQGTSEAGAALLWGFVMIAVGGAGLVYLFSDSLIIPIVFALVMLICYIVVKKTR